MQPALVSIFLDYWCNFSCKHCSVGSSPKTRMKMPEELLDKLFDDIGAIKSLKLAVFTGGEPTLHLDMLRHGIMRAKKLGLLTRVVSNGWWAKSPEAAKSFLGNLRAVGLDEINTSYDDFHEPFLSIDRIAYLIHGAMALNMQVGMGVINDHEAKFGTQSVRSLLAEKLNMSWEDLSRHVVIVDDYPTPAGTGETLELAGMDAGDKLNLGCPDIMKTISVHPNGSIKGCCGHGQLYQKDLAIGNINDESLGAIIDRSTENIFYWWLHYVGPRNILRRLGVEGTYTSICHACNDLLGNHRSELLSYLEANSDSIFQREILVSDHYKRMASWVASQEEVIVRRFELSTSEDGGKGVVLA